jgi:hypothetical protein
VTISSNSAQSRGGGLFLFYSNPTLNNVTIDNNNTYGTEGASGGGIYCDQSSPHLNNVKITNNYTFNFGGGIYIGEYCNPRLDNVLIANNEAYHAGGGIFVSHSNPILANITFTGNTSQDHGGGLSLFESSPCLINCIMWDNTPAEIFMEESDRSPSELTILYSDIEGGEEAIVTNENVIYWLQNNCNTDPLFTEEYHLQSNSECIDAGTAYFEFNGIVLVDMSEDEYYGSYPDMGCYENSPNSEENSEIDPVNNILKNYPNPFNPSTRIAFELREDCDVKLGVYNLKGQLVSELADGITLAGEHFVEWDGYSGRSVGSGVYLVRLRAGDDVFVRKIMLMK